MTVISVSTAKIKEGRRLGEYLKTWPETKASYEKHGARNVRLMVAVEAGEGTGTLAVTYESDDFAAHGAVQDGILSDREALAAAMSPDSPTVAVQLSTWNELG